MDTEKVVCDSDVLIDYLDGKNNRHQLTYDVIHNLIGVNNTLISSVTKMEILAGAQNKGELYRIEKLVKKFDEFKLNIQISEIAVDLIYRYNLSHGLAIPDALIAATAIHIGCPIFTYNIRDYKFIPNIKLYQY